MDSSEATKLIHNSEAPWDRFESDSYLRDNYSRLRLDDAWIVAGIRDHFAAAGIPAGAVGIDVGTGPNLYPALGMLPFVEQIELYDYSASNVGWLTGQRAAGWPVWGQGLQAFWDVYREHEAYAALGPQPQALLRERTRVIQGSVFDLPQRTDPGFDVGTMFFVAESLSDDRAEFEQAVRRFLGALRPGAPFAAAFMEQSAGYHIGDIRFPACPVLPADVVAAMTGEVVGLEVERMGNEWLGADLPLRPGYAGMIRAVGFRAGLAVGR